MPLYRRKKKLIHVQPSCASGAETPVCNPGLGISEKCCPCLQRCKCPEGFNELFVEDFSTGLPPGSIISPLPAPTLFYWGVNAQRDASAFNPFWDDPIPINPNADSQLTFPTSAIHVGTRTQFAMETQITFVDTLAFQVAFGMDFTLSAGSFGWKIEYDNIAEQYTLYTKDNFGVFTYLTHVNRTYDPDEVLLLIMDFKAKEDENKIIFCFNINDEEVFEVEFDATPYGTLDPSLNNSYFYVKNTDIPWPNEGFASYSYYKILECDSTPRICPADPPPCDESTAIFYDNFVDLTNWTLNPGPNMEWVGDGNDAILRAANYFISFQATGTIQTQLPIPAGQDFVVIETNLSWSYINNPRPVADSFVTTSFLFSTLIQANITSRFWRLNYSGNTITVPDNTISYVDSRTLTALFYKASESPINYVLCFYIDGVNIGNLNVGPSYPSGNLTYGITAVNDFNFSEVLPGREFMRVHSVCMDAGIGSLMFSASTESYLEILGGYTPSLS